MAIGDPYDQEQMRIRILLVVLLAAFGVLLAVLWSMQVAHGKRYQRDLTRQSVRRVRVPGMRGRIFDRNGVCVADNRPSYCIAIYLEELRQAGRWTKTIGKVDAMLDQLAGVLDLPRQLSTNDIKTHIKKRLPLPLLAWKDVDEAALAKLAERGATLPGVDFYTEPLREYPFGRAACHLIGYAGRAEVAPDEDEPFHYYLTEMAGKSGIEKSFDGVLRGEAGGRLVRVDVSGYWHEDLALRKPHTGHDVLLALDIRAQQLVEQALTNQHGAAVIVDPSNGDVLALASSPGFDPNAFMPSISPEQWKSLVEDEGKPLLDRAVAGAYAPGSTFKPVVAMAALENHKATPRTSFSCPGYFMLGRAHFSCWYQPGHGLLNLREGLEHSCNVYFFRLALQTGYEPILHMAAALGFGQRTDIALDYETPGLLPDEGWKRRMYHDAWRDGDTCNLAIGQGALLVTPVQMAMMAAALANGGRLYKPRVVTGIRDLGQESVRAIPAEVVNNLNWSPANLKVVREGMRDVVMSPRGTGKLAAIPNVEVAGKTGTAEYGKKEENRNLGWMIAFAPYDNPRYAVAVMIEDAVSGGITVAPLMKQILRGLFEDRAKEKGAG
ncbi:MAG: penicillin-binding protein 2 [Verrucomicrobiota bacterium]